MTVVLLIPVLRRPHRVTPLLESIAAATPDAHSVLFIVDPNDHLEHAAIRAAGGEMLICPGNYATKINAAVRSTDEPEVFLGADDLHFHPGWLAAARAHLEPGVGVVGTNDLGNSRVQAGQHATHSLVTRPYTELGTIDDPGRVLHEGYPHEFVDDEFIETARRRRAFAAATDSIVEHLHPLWGKAPTDDLYDAHPARMRAGRRIYRRRRHLWM